MTTAASHLDFDVVIAGGGMAGATFALALARQSPSLRVAVVEPVPAPTPTNSATGAAEFAVEGVERYQPSYDSRATAMAWGTRQIYQSLGLWEALSPQATPIERIHVSERGRFGGSKMLAAEHGQPALGYVVDNAWTGLNLQAALTQQSGIHWICPARVSAVENRAGHVRLQLEGEGVNSGAAVSVGSRSLSTALLVIADGGRSGLREKLGFQVEREDYGQVAFTANVSTTKSHQFEAFERFTPSGPIALLPRGNHKRAENRCGLVWTLPPAEAEQMQVLPDDEFLTALQQAFGWRLGRFTKVGQRSAYALGLQRVRHPIQPHIVLVGNAAHTLHPVAGQGFNLAIRGLMQLAREIGCARERGASPGDLTVLNRFWQAQSSDVEALVRASNALVSLFSGRTALPLELGRSAGLMALDMLPPVRRWFTRQAMGLGRGPAAQSAQ